MEPWLGFRCLNAKFGSILGCVLWGELVLVLICSKGKARRCQPFCVPYAGDKQAIDACWLTTGAGHV